MRKITCVLTLLLTLLLCSAHAQEAAKVRVKEPALRTELLKRADQDQAIRNELISKGVQNPDQAILKRMEAIDADNTKRMVVIVSQYGWPGPELVGRDGADAAILLIQHADLATQQRMLPFVEKAYRGGAVSGQDYALFLDKLRVAEGKPQVYGTQAKRFEEWKGQEPVLQPIEDEANVDKRRAEVGLPPLAEYKEFLKRMYFPENQPKPNADTNKAVNKSARTFHCREANEYKLVRVLNPKRKRDSASIIPEDLNIQVGEDVISKIELPTGDTVKNFSLNSTEKTKAGFEIRVDWGGDMNHYEIQFNFRCKGNSFYLYRVTTVSLSTSNPHGRNFLDKKKTKVTNIRPNLPIEKFVMTDYL